MTSRTCFVAACQYALLAVLMAFLSPSNASAHERRTVGKYSLVVGFSVEPAWQSSTNGAQVTVTVPTENNRAVEGLADTVKATVAFGGGQPKEFKLRALFGKPGEYVADFIPTRAGAYIFTFAGTIEGAPLDERFESGPGRFADVESPENIQFPERLPPVNDVARGLRATDERAANALAEAQSARLLAMVGVGVGAVGALVALIAVALATKRRAANDPSSLTG